MAAIAVIDFREDKNLSARAARRISRGCTIGRRIGDPAVDFGFAPARSIGADRYLARESAFLHFAIDGRAGQAGAVEDGFKPDDAVWFGHSLGSSD